MRATLKLVNLYFWKTIYGPIISFVIPIILLAILGNIMRLEYVYPGILALSLMFIGLIAVPLSFMEIKDSTLYKYINVSPVDNRRFSIAIILYYFIIASVASVIVLLSTMILFPDSVFPSGGIKYGVLSGISTFKGFANLVVAIFIHLSLVVVFGVAISKFSKTPQQALTIAITILLPTMFLSGMVISVDVISQSEVMQWTSRLIPFRYSVGNIVIASTPKNQLGDIIDQLSNVDKELIFNIGEEGASTLGITDKGTMFFWSTQDINYIRTIWIHRERAFWNRSRWS